jgi:hypothetical protein
MDDLKARYHQEKQSLLAHTKQLQHTLEEITQVSTLSDWEMLKEKWEKNWQVDIQFRPTFSVLKS